MNKIELFTADRDYVATVEIPPFLEGKEPEFLIWGERTFKKGVSPSEYYECFAVVAVTPAPGLEREPECPEEIRENEYRRPCELRKGHLGRHHYTVVTSQNMGRLRVPAPPVDRGAVTTLHGTPVEKVREDHAKQPTGMHDDYIVLTEEERAKGFQRPVRRSYRHVIPGPKYDLRDLTEEEHQRYDKFKYVKFEKYPENHHLSGRFWTQADLDRARKGCNAVTSMGQALAETYARDPAFYGATFCCRCGTHYPVGESGEFVWEGTEEKVGT